MNATTIEREWCDDRDLARRTPISRVTWQKLRYAGEGPKVYKVGRRTLYRWSEVQAWLASQPMGGQP